MMVTERRKPCLEVYEQSATMTTIPDGTKASLKRLCGFYGGSERELLARLISDLERDTLAMLPGSEREEYFGAAL